MDRFAHAIAGLLAALPAAASATTWYVSGTGSDSNTGSSLTAPFATLQHAANQTQPGDTVMVLNGTYTTPCKGCDVVDITTSGTATAPITYRAYPGQSPLINFLNAWVGINISANYIIIDGFELAGGRTAITLGYALSQTHNLNNYRTSGNGIVIGCNAGGQTTFSHVTIQDNIVHDAPGGGIASCYADYITIQGNTSYLNAYWSPYATSGISVWEMRDTDSNTGYKNFVTGNLSYQNREYVKNTETGTITDGNGIIIDDNKNTQTINVPYGGRTYVANNIVYENGGSGIHAYDSAHVDIVYNTAYLNNQTPSINEGQIFGNTATDVNIINNILFAPPKKDFYSNYANDPSVLYNDNVLYSTTPKDGEKGLAPGPNDIIANPLFNNPGNGDFTLLAGSPAIGAGTATLAPETDFAGKPRPTPGGGFDRGALQYVK